MTRTTYELFPSINKETLQTTPVAQQPVSVSNNKFGFKPEPLPIKSSFSPPSPTPSASQQTITIVESLVNRRAGAIDLEENASSKRVSYMPFTRSTYETSLSFKNRDALTNNNLDSLIKQPLSQYTPYKPTQIAASFSNISSGSKTLKFEPQQKQSSISSNIKTDSNLDRQISSSLSTASFSEKPLEVFNNSSKTLMEENEYNDRSVAEDDNNSSVKNYETDPNPNSKSTLSQYSPHQQELNVSTMTANTLKFEPQNILNSPRSLNSSNINSESYKELNKEVRPDEEKTVLKQGAELAKSQQFDYELGLNSLKNQRIPNKDSFYAMTKPSQKNEAAPFASDSPSKSTILKNEIELEAKTTKNEQGNNRLDRVSQKIDEIVYKGTSQREAVKPEQKKIQPATKSTVQSFTGLYGLKASKPLSTLTTMARPSRTILETTKKPTELDKTSKKGFLPTLQSSSSKLGAKTVETNSASRLSNSETANKNSMQIRDVSKTRQLQPSFSSRTITEKPLNNRVSAQVKEAPRKNSYMPTKSIIEKPSALHMPTKTINESFAKQDLTKQKQPSTTTTKTILERKSSFGFSKPTPLATSPGVIDSNQKKISELESALRKTFLQSSNLKNVKPEVTSSRASISSRGSISYMPTQSHLEPSSYSRSSTANKDFSSKIRQPVPIKSVPDKGLNQKQSFPQAKLKETVSDIRNSYLSTKTTIEKPASYSYSNIASSVSTKPKENTVISQIPVVHKTMPSKTLVEMRSSSSFGFSKPKETKQVNPELKSSESLIDQLVISLERHEKEQQKRSKLISHLLGGKTNLDSSKETLSNNYSTNNSFLTNKPAEENFLDNSNNFDDPNYSQTKENSLAKKDLKKSEPKKVEYSQNFKPKAVPFRGSEQKSANNNSLKPQGLKSSIFLSKNIQQKQPVNDRKQVNQKGKQPQKNAKQSGYLSCRSRTFSNLDVVFEVEREEYSRCSDDSKSTIKTWSIATNDPERSFSSFEDVKGLPKEENLFPNEEKNDVERDSSDVVDNCDKPVEADDILAEPTHISVNSIETTESNDIKSNSEQKESNSENEIDELKNFLTNIGVISDQCVYSSKSDIVEEIFKSIDKDAVGKVNVEEALVIFEKINSNKDAYTNAEVENIVRQSDSDSDGFIDLQEFILIFDKF